MHENEKDKSRRMKNLRKHIDIGDIVRFNPQCDYGLRLGYYLVTKYEQHPLANKHKHLHKNDIICFDRSIIKYGNKSSLYRNVLFDMLAQKELSSRVMIAAPKLG